MKRRFLMAIDPSLTCSGWALFSLSTGELLGVGKVKAPPPSIPLGIRLQRLQDQIRLVLEETSLSMNDVLVCEAPTTMKDPRAAFKVEQVRGLFETLARGRGVCVPGRIHPRSVHQEVMGLRGKQLKRELVKHSAVFVVNSVHGVGLERIGFNSDMSHLKKNQDIVDAILVGSLGLSWIRAADQGGFSVEEYFDRVRSHTNQRSFASRSRRRVAA